MNKSIRSFARTLVKDYATYNKLDGFYNLVLSDIPSFDLHKFASLFLQDRSLANECCGSDNPDFEKIMIPSLINLLSNSTSQDEKIEFIQEWTDGVMNYFFNDMQAMINDELEIYNMEHAA